jgi:hypothetical protein
MYVNGSYFDITAEQAVDGAKAYGGTLSEGTRDILDLLSEVYITFPDMHSAASWAKAYDLMSKINISFHGHVFSDQWTIRYDFK